jgi:putative hydrolase of the HAD superfamily
MTSPCKAIVFDLDNCLCDARAVGEELFEPAFEAIRNANRGDVPEERLRQAFDECWFTSFDLVAKRYRFSDAMFRAGFDAFSRLEVAGPLEGYPDLPVLRQLAGDKYLVTSGFRRLQESKVRALGIADWFRRVVVDAVDVPPQLGKKAIFEDILRESGHAPGEIVVVGDNPLSELAAGRQLGMQTVQTVRPGVTVAAADFHIGRLDELPPILAGER